MIHYDRAFGLGWNWRRLGNPRNRSPIFHSQEELDSWLRGWDMAESLEKFKREEDARAAAAPVKRKMSFTSEGL